MRRCIELSRLSKGQTRTNPLVGSLFLYEGKVINEGYHMKYGEGHAEVNALNANVITEKMFQQGTLFVSLEPCFHYGKTPPCVDLVLSKGITHIVVACEDPNPRVSGKSIEKLKQADIQVDMGLLGDDAKAHVRPYVVGITQQRPYVILKFAKSADGAIGLRQKAVWLTNTFAKYLVHKWRGECDAILVGTNTALIDNPQLTNRIYFGKKNIIRILLDKNLRVPQHYSIYDNEALTIVLTEKEKAAHDNVIYYQTDFGKDFLTPFLTYLYQEHKVGCLMVEGGAQVLTTFIEAKLWDEARVFETPVVLGEQGVRAPTLQGKLVGTHKIMDNLLSVFLREP